MWRIHSRFVCAMLACLLVALTHGSAHATLQAAPQTDGADTEIAPGPHAAWDTPSDEASAPPASTTRASGTTAASDCLGSPTRGIRYTSDGVIHLEGCNQTFTLTEVAAAPVVGPTRLALVDAANKIWQLNVKLKVEEGATLRVVGGTNGDASTLR